MRSEFWKGRRVFVTGATGFVGARLVGELLAAEADVAVLVRDADPRSELYRNGDIGRTAVVNGRLEDIEALERAVVGHAPDTVFHLGAQALVGAAVRSPLQTLESNVRGTYNLLEACRRHAGIARRIVVASSDKAYGSQPVLPCVETMPLAGEGPYEVSKSCADLITRSYHLTYGLPAAVARCGNIFGGGDLNWSRIVPGTIRSLHRGERPAVRSDGRCVRDYIYVGDAAAGYMLLAEKMEEAAVAGEAFNFSLEIRATALEMVDRIRRLMGCESLVPDILDEARHEIRDQSLSAAKARTVLGWRPEFALDQGLSETIRWYRGFLG